MLSSVLYSIYIQTKSKRTITVIGKCIFVPLRLKKHMEGASSIMKRIAGRDHPQVLVDAQSNPINVDKRSLTTIIDAQSGQLDHPVKSNMVQGSEEQTDNNTSLFDKVSSVLNPLSSSNNVPPTLTSVNGYRLGDVTHCLHIGGHPVVSDGILFEKQQTFNRSKIVERAVHACGSGAFGYFEVTHDVSSLCKADFLSKVGKITPVIVRFSTTTYGREFPDSARNPRGIAVKFYTDEGNYDILSINFPVFFVRDPTQGPDVIRSQQRNPNNFRVNWDATFDFMSLVPESMLANTWYWSDHGTPVGKMSILIFKRNISLNYRVAFYGCLSMSYI
jgi:catalase